MSPTGLSAETWLVILVALVAANLAFVSSKFLLIKPLPDKHVGWCLLEMLIWYALVGLLAYILENAIGNVFPKRWEFFAVTICLFLVGAFPGFTWRFLMKHRHDVHN
ncbi:MAG: hypothetical protein RLZZ410_376 [Pseudomonadota bacterium]|jgi:hypothetical protein